MRSPNLPANRVAVVASPNGRTVPKKWFNPSRIDEDVIPDVDHGEFQSPVWLAVALAMHADRDEDVAWTTTATPDVIPGTAHDHRGGQLRTLLACIAASTDASTDASMHSRRATSPPLALLRAPRRETATEVGDTTTVASARGPRTLLHRKAHDQRQSQLKRDVEK